VHQEIRFVKAAGITRFTFGRSPGPSHSHIQLCARTASRMHGYMVFENGRWRIGNLSQTNSVVVNGSRLENGGSEQLLVDGDRIEFGELAFVFRER
jgi:pSer/pThr/pTyr-binding forkhead associated (FHA) protein